jgi:hypothetical protein
MVSGRQRPTDSRQAGGEVARRRRMGHYGRWVNQFRGGGESISSPERVSMVVEMEWSVTSVVGQMVGCRRQLTGLESFMALRRSSVRCRPDQRLAGQELPA